ncbi:unnamed protein product, partial [Owenia fusiformis]
MSTPDRFVQCLLMLWQISDGLSEQQQIGSGCASQHVIELSVTPSASLDLTTYLSEETCVNPFGTCTSIEPSIATLRLSQNGQKETDPFAKKKISACFDPRDGWKWTYISSTTLGHDLFSLVSVDETMLVFKIGILDNEGSIATISTTEEISDERTNRPTPTITPKMTSTPATVCSLERQIKITVGIGEKVELNEYLRDEYCAKSQQSCSPVRPTRGNVYATNRGKKQNVFSPKTW